MFSILSSMMEVCYSGERPAIHGFLDHRAAEKNRAIGYSYQSVRVAAAQPLKTRLCMVFLAVLLLSSGWLPGMGARPASPKLHLSHLYAARRGTDAGLSPPGCKKCMICCTWTFFSSRFAMVSKQIFCEVGVLQHCG
jgi:hypothetical protein